MNNNQQPPPPMMKPPSSATGPPPPPTTNIANNISTGKTPVARRTRSNKVALQQTVGPPPPSNNNNNNMAQPPPPPQQTTNNTLPSTIFNPSLSGYENLPVSDAIAKRRAELRRLQQNQSLSQSQQSATIVARSKLGSNHPPPKVIRPTQVRPIVGPSPPLSSSSSSASNNKSGGDDIGAAPPQINNQPPPNPPGPPVNNTRNNNNNMAITSTPIVAQSGTQPTPPSTATITRRLDNSYGSNSPTPLSAAHQSISSTNNNAVVYHGKEEEVGVNNMNMISPPQSREEFAATTDTINYNIDAAVPPIPIPANTTHHREDHQSLSSIGNKKRTSEIFAVGKSSSSSSSSQPLYNEYHRSSTGDSMGGDGNRGGMMSLSSVNEGSSNPFSPSGPVRQAAVAGGGAGGGVSVSQPPTAMSIDRGSITASTTAPPPIVAQKSPFGQPRTIVNIKRGDSLMSAVPPFEVVQQQQQDDAAAPSPNAAAGGYENAAAGGHENDNGSDVGHEDEPVLTNNIMPPPTLNELVEEKRASSIYVADDSSGKSTPIHSNSASDITADHTGENMTEQQQQQYATSNNMGKPDMDRLMNDLQRIEREKKEALEQVNKLRLLLATNHHTSSVSSTANTAAYKPSTSSSSNNNELANQFREMVQTQGESAAVTWMSKQLATTPQGIASASITSRGASLSIGGGDLLSSVIPPLTPRSRPGSRAASPERGGTRGKRIMTPLPKQLNSNTSLDGMMMADGGIGGAAASKHQQHDGGSPNIEHEYLIKAAKCIPNEYGTMLASYIVRRPYVQDHDVTNEEEDVNWSSYQHLSTNFAYTANSNVFNPDTLEIIAYINADSSVLILSNKSNVRHGFDGNNVDSSEWSVFNDVEEMDKALGKVTYIDGEGNERDYWLGT